MGKSFYVSGFRDGDPRGGRDLWVDLQVQLKQEGNQKHVGSDAIPAEQRPIIDPRTGEQAINPLTGKPRFRSVRKDAALGFDSDAYHYAGDRVVILNEEPEVKGGKATGDVLLHFQRIDDQGRSLGTYEQRWAKDGEGRHRSTGKARRYFSMG